MINLRTIWAAVLLVPLTACENIQGATAVHQASPAPATLSAATREKLQGTVDFEALDRLLALMSQTEREHFLATLTAPQGEIAGEERAEMRDVQMLVWVSDPEKQKLLERVYAPLRARLAAEAARRNPILRPDSASMPGSEPGR